MSAQRLRVLVAENIGSSGIELLRESFDVDTAFDQDGFVLADRIGEYEGLVIRSATNVDADLIGRATRLRAIGRAGVGVDNVDVAEATKRGIIVANAPHSNVVTAAEHTMALMLALARNVPQAHAALVGGEWARAKYSGVELQDKVLGILGFGRIGQLVAQRAVAFGMRVLGYDPYVSPERYAELGAERAESPDEIYAAADFITLHLPNTPDTKGWLNAEVLAKCRDGVRILNVARGPLVVEEDLVAALKSGKVAGVALDVFREEPVTEHELFGMPGVIVTPHLGASTAEATDRAGYQAAEQVVAALSDGVVTTAVNVPAIPMEDIEVVAPFVPLCRLLGRLAAAVSESRAFERIEVELLGDVAERETRTLVLAALAGVLGGEDGDTAVNEVNAPAIADERGIEVVEKKTPVARDFVHMVRVSVETAAGRQRVAGTTIGYRNRPHLLEVWGQRFNLQFADELALFRYTDVPGMIGRIGTCMGEAGVNISSATLGRGAEGDEDELAVLVLATDSPTPQSVIDAVLAMDGVTDARSISL